MVRQQLPVVGNMAGAVSVGLGSVESGCGDGDCATPGHHVSTIHPPAESLRTIAQRTITQRTITQRIDAITHIPPEYLRPDPPCPRSVKVELTARCDLNCFFCATSKRLRTKADMTWELFASVVREMRDCGVEELGVFYLGESMLSEWLDRAIAYAKNDCDYPYVFLTTNGRLATAEKVKGCMAAGLDSLKFSFNNADPEQFHEVTGVKARDFHTIVENIKDARRVRDEGGYQCGLYASSIQYDGDQLEKMTRAVDEIRDSLDEHYWLPLYGQAGLTSGANGTVPTAGNPGRIGALRAPLPCWSIFTEGHVTYDGRLSACCFDHDGRFSMGRLGEQPFMEAWHSEPFQALRRAHIEKSVAGTACEQCIAYE